MPSAQPTGDPPEEEATFTPSPSSYKRRKQSSGLRVIVIVVLLILVVAGTGLYLGGVFKSDGKEAAVAPAPPVKKESKADRLQREYDEAKGKLKSLQDRQQELKRTKAAHDEAFEAEYAVAKTNRDAAFELLQRRQKQIDADAEAIVASAKEIKELMQRMQTLLDELEREKANASKSPR